MAWQDAVSNLRELADMMERESPLILEVVEALRGWMGRTDLKNRWPCVDCGRDGPGEAKRLIETRVGGQAILTGCWLCNTDDLRDATRAVLAKIDDV